MRAPVLAAIGVAAYAIFLLAEIPAAFLLARAQDAQPGKFEVREASGTAWRGTAKVTINSPGGPIAVDHLEWHWLPARLFVGHFAFDVAAEGAGMTVRSEAGRSLSSWELRDLKVRGDAASMTTLAPWVAPWRPEGWVTIASARLATDGVELSGEARVEWKGASVAISEVRPLGTYRADITAEGHAGKVAISTLEGALQVSGQGTLTPPARFAFTGQARAADTQAKALEPLLNLMGPQRADGARDLNWRVN